MKEKSNSSNGGKYDVFFREEVVTMVLTSRPVVEVAQSLGIGENLIYRWKGRYGPNQRSVGVKSGQQWLAGRISTCLAKCIREPRGRSVIF